MLRHTILGELIPTPRGIRFTEDGDVVTNAEMIRMNLREYMKQMYSPADIVRPEFLTSTYVFPESAAVMDSPFTMEELREAIMKVGRVACGVDGIPNELMKVLVQSTMDSILMNTCLLICNLIFKGYSTKPQSPLLGSRWQLHLFQYLLRESRFTLLRPKHELYR